ncbi:tryptophan 2,3-dioxygenase family protein [Algihabitans albus]|uniref:tryptophan 2,3-dioxygenase family protein n=1 Tax=Algihabitans albus TaxID=2164067 RepID=UPI000E5D262D|nr:tryptophan 2,3-dioxygenase family protein [Algihabitans albus]
MKPYNAKPLPPRDPDMCPEGNHYWSYHSLDALLTCKQPVTESQDEDLFIAIHQICELAFHQMILDLERALDGLAAADRAEAVYFLKRVNKLWRTVNATMPVLGGLRAFAEFRTSIGPTSGFQSFQFRRLEIMSGVPRYWQGGTANAEGAVHVAESEFDKRYGAQVTDWLERYRHHGLAHYCRQLIDGAGAEDVTVALARLRQDEATAALFAEFAAYDRHQLQFHRAHLQLATRQLQMVGVETGTGGTSFRDYLQKYDKTVAPLFPGLSAGTDEAEA